MPGDSREVVFANQNNCMSVKCCRCRHADQLLVERSSSYARCACRESPYCGTWSGWSYGSGSDPDECAHYAEITEAAEKHRRNVAWKIACDRKMMSLHLGQVLRTSCPLFAVWVQEAERFSAVFMEVK